MNINIDVYCANCGNALSHSDPYNDSIDIDPCEICLEEEYNKGYDDGKEE